jgi:hypothetical protein
MTAGAFSDRCFIGFPRRGASPDFTPFGWFALQVREIAVCIASRRVLLMTAGTLLQPRHTVPLLWDAREKAGDDSKPRLVVYASSLDLRDRT